MGKTNFDIIEANQVKQNGMMVIPWAVGNTYYVDSDLADASDDNSGKTPATALATIDGAINKCTANNGDIIMVMPSHSESYTTTGIKATFDVAGVTVIGLGSGSDRPTFSYGHTGAYWTVTAANVTFINLLFVSAIDGITTYVTASGNDFKVLSCAGRDTTDIEVVSDITVTGDRFVCKNYHKEGYTSGNANIRVFYLDGVNQALIEKCIFMTKVTTAVVNFTGNACYNIVIKDCDFLVSGTTDFSKTIVDTITGSTWEANGCFDLGAGSSFSGGSGSALAGDDVSAVAAAVSATMSYVKVENEIGESYVKNRADDIKDENQSYALVLKSSIESYNKVESETNESYVKNRADDIKDEVNSYSKVVTDAIKDENQSYVLVLKGSVESYIKVENEVGESYVKNRADDIKDENQSYALVLKNSMESYNKVESETNESYIKNRADDLKDEINSYSRVVTDEVLDEVNSYSKVVTDENQSYMLVMKNSVESYVLTTNNDNVNSYALVNAELILSYLAVIDSQVT